MTEYKVGDKVTVNRHIIEDANDCHPSFILANPGDVLFVRDVRTHEESRFQLYISHEGVDGSFGVMLEEVRPLEPLTSPNNLVYSVQFESWNSVAAMLKEFKKKRHKGFYFEVEEGPFGPYNRVEYRVRVFKD